MLEGMVFDASQLGALNTRRLPPKINFRPLPKELTSMSAFAKKAIEKENTIGELTGLVDKVASNQDTPEMLDRLLNLQNGREIGNLSRDKALGFDQDHEAVKKLAILKSAIRANASKKTRAENAQDLRKWCEQLPDHEGLKQFNVLSVDNFDDDFRDSLSQLRRGMGPESITQGPHEELRKILRQFSSYYQVKNAVAHSAENDSVLTFLNALSGRLGAANDQRVLESFGNSVDLKTAKTPLPYSDRKKIRDFVERVELDQMDLY